MSSNGEFFNNYMVLKAEEATLFELVCILCWHDFENINCVLISESAKLSSFRHRWIIFVSILLQKIFLLIKAPTACIGTMIERILNFRSSSSKETFRSFIGNLDKRIDLDESIGIEDSRFSAALSVMAAKLSYENKAVVESVISKHWKMKFLGFYECYNDYEGVNTSEAIMFQDKETDPNLIVVSFRGTSVFNTDDWRTDIDLSWYELVSMAQPQAHLKSGTIGNVHFGFMKALGLQKLSGWPIEIEQDPARPFAYYAIREQLRHMLLNSNDNTKFIVTGHSLGAALAILFVGVLALHEDEDGWLLNRLEGVYTFGQPRVGDEEFGNFMNKKLKAYNVNYRRYVYGNDIVPRLPFDDKTLFFKHFGSCLYYNSLYRGRELDEEPNKNYFSLLWVVPKILIAMFELVRSFIIGYTTGEEYTEWWFLKLFRVVGVAFPGISAHGPQDYVNLTRIGTDLSSLPRQYKKLN